MTGTREMQTTTGKGMGKILARTVACGAATTGASIFGASLIGNGIAKVISGFIKERRAGSVVKGIISVGIGGVVVAGTQIINDIVIDKVVDDLMELEQANANEDVATEENLDDYSSIDWSRLNMAARKVRVEEPSDTPVEE